MDVAVEEVVADVCGGSFHALDEDFSFSHVEVVAQERACGFALPEEVFSNSAPELCGAGRESLGGRITSQTQKTPS